MGRVVGFWVESSDFGPKSDDLGHRILKSDFIPSDFAKSDCISRPILFSDQKTKIRSSESDRIINGLKAGLFQLLAHNVICGEKHPRETEVRSQSQDKQRRQNQNKRKEKKKHTHNGKRKRKAESVKEEGIHYYSRRFSQPSVAWYW